MIESKHNPISRQPGESMHAGNPANQGKMGGGAALMVALLMVVLGAGGFFAWQFKQPGDVPTSLVVNADNRVSDSGQHIGK